MSIANAVYIPVLSGIFAEGELLLYILLSNFLFSSTQSDCVYKWRFLSRIGGVDNGPCKNYNQKSNKNEQEVYIYIIYDAFSVKLQNIITYSSPSIFATQPVMPLLLNS